MVDAFCAMYTSMPEITLITAISVVVARMMPRSVRKLRSLLPRSECKAPFTASQNDAFDLIQPLISFNLGFHSNLGRAAADVISIRLTDPVHYRVIQPESLGRAANEADVASVFGGDEAYARVRQDGCGIVNR